MMMLAASLNGDQLTNTGEIIVHKCENTGALSVPLLL